MEFRYLYISLSFRGVFAHLSAFPKSYAASDFLALRLLSQSHVRYSSSEESSSSFEHSAEVSNLNWKVSECFNELLLEGQYVDITI